MVRRGNTPEQLGLPVVSAEDWYTPAWLFDMLNAEYGPFTLDAAALESNAKCGEYFTPEQDGRIQPWSGVVFCNPPYKDLIKWVKKARYETTEGGADRVLLLLPAQTSTEWFHDYALPFARLHWIRRRVKFGGTNREAAMSSVAVIFDRSANDNSCCSGKRDDDCAICPHGAAFGEGDG